MSRRKNTAWLTSLAAALLLAGCMSDDGEGLSHEEYQDEIQAITAGPDVSEASLLFVELRDAFQDRAACTAKAAEFHTRLEAIVTAVEALDPPADAEAAQRDFVAAARESVRAIGRLADDVAHGRVQCGEDYRDHAYGLPSTERAEDVLRRLQQDADYLIFGD